MTPLPHAGHRGQAGGRVHARGPVARTRKAVADPDVALLGGAIEPGEGLDLAGRDTGGGRCPGGRLVGEMGLHLGVPIGMAGEIGAVRMAVLQQQVDHRRRQRAVAAGLDGQVQVGLLGRSGAVGIDHHQLGAARLTGLGDVGHDVDLGVDRVAAPDDDQLGLLDLPRIHPLLGPHPGEPAGFREHGADGGQLAGVLLDVAQAFDAVALHVAHGTGVEVRPDGFRAVALLGLDERFGHRVEGVVPGHGLERLDPLALVADPA